MNTIPDGTMCDDGEVCTEFDTCSEDVCTGIDFGDECCLDSADCMPTNCNPASCGTDHRCHDDPVVCDEPGLCQTGACNPIDGQCVYTDVMCESSIDACSTNECTAESDPECIPVAVPCEEGDHACTPLLGCDEVEGCLYGEPGPECCVDNGDCATGEACNDATDTCEPSCFTMRDAVGTPEECVAACEASNACPSGVCDDKLIGDNLAAVEACLAGSDATCEAIDEFAASEGCFICPPPEPEPVPCPCWDGPTANFPLPPSLADYWSGAADCSSFDRCENVSSPTFEVSSALCVPAGLETAVTNVSGNLKCKVRLGPNQSILVSISPTQYASCLAEHQAFTQNKNVANGCDLPNP